MSKWLEVLKYDLLPTLLSLDEPALNFFVRRDLKDEKDISVKELWDLPEARRILRRQQKDGRWKYPTPQKLQRAYDKLETFRQIGVLIEMYGFDRSHLSIKKAAEFLFTFQTKEGDFRGIYANQYSPNYSASIVERLVKAGYRKEKEVVKCLEWLLTMRQDDGGWVIPVRTRLKTLGDMYEAKETLEPDRSKPFSHLVTDIVLRAFANHPDYARKKEVVEAGKLLKTRFFKPDKYPDHKSAICWTKFQYPFWWSHLLSALDSLGKIGLKKNDPDISKGLSWFIKNQDKSGLWPTGYGSDKNPNRKAVPYWIGLSICRMLRVYYG
ncbi:hypothetical protein JW766_04165 [Candidatus Dojkabacteria bacterium]|nr:hypothetical protein [Candidatus Dojkabacteria bacterium]